MTNHEISRFLEKISFVMNIRGINPFKIRAYDRAVRIIDDMPEPVEELIERDELQTIPGIGKGLAEVITEIAETGQSSALDELMGDIPDTIFEVAEVPGIGPKKAAQMYNELGAASLEDLERAARTGALLELRGFSRKTADKIIQGIEIRKHALEYKSIGYALPLARRIMADLEKGGKVIQASEAGKIRRRRETVNRLDMVCSVNDPDALFGFIDSLPYIDRLVSSDGSKAVFLAEENFPVHIFAVEPSRYYSTLFQATGSAEHVESVEEILRDRGIEPGENGTLISGGIPITIRGEDGIYRLAGLDWIPPEIRETGGEVAEFKTGSAHPVLLEQPDLKGDMQMHSTYSDGAASIGEMAEKAMEMGYSYIAVTDHSQSLHIAHGLDRERIPAQHAEIDRLNGELAGRFRIFKAAEVDILSDGSLDYDDEILKKLDFVLVSIHMGMKMPREKMTRRVIRAIQHPGVHCLAHPSGRLIGRRPEFDMDWEAVFQAAKDAGIAIEINSHPSRLDLDDTRCRLARDMGIPIIINTDAHSPDQMELIEYGVFVARRGQLTRRDVLNTLDAGEMENWLKER